VRFDGPIFFVVCVVCLIFWLSVYCALNPNHIALCHVGPSQQHHSALCQSAAVVVAAAAAVALVLLLLLCDDLLCPFAVMSCDVIDCDDG
jgi:hypothetical protein